MYHKHVENFVIRCDKNYLNVSKMTWLCIDFKKNQNAPNQSSNFGIITRFFCDFVVFLQLHLCTGHFVWMGVCVCVCVCVWTLCFTQYIDFLPPIISRVPYPGSMSDRYWIFMVCEKKGCGWISFFKIKPILCDCLLSVSEFGQKCQFSSLAAAHLIDRSALYCIATESALFPSQNSLGFAR